ncbi:MAG: formate/nitrite transporter family protein [Planctomycetota bacterium]|nr:formate/nitrite transporter family protein [Planctomycetota bacterium]
MNTPEPPAFDALLPHAMAEKAEQAGVAKAALPFVPLFLLAVLAGAFIALGAVFYTVVTTGAAEGTWFGLARLLGGLAFCLGLILVVVAGAELFTGNNLIVMAWAGGRVSTAALLRNWGIAYVGNFVGAVATAGLVVIADHQGMGGGAVGRNAVAIATAKCQLGFVQAVALGALCNALVCLAVWLCLSARTTTDKILAILFPITAFVAAGFEHSVANMYFVPAGIFMAADAGAAGQGPTWASFFLDNLLPVTLGNIVGGSLLVGAVYWLVYLRRRS